MNDHFDLIAFFLEQALEAPLPRRIRIYRGLARICGDPKEEAKLKALANRLEKVERSCRDFNIRFVQRHTD